MGTSPRRLPPPGAFRRREPGRALAAGHSAGRREPTALRPGRRATRPGGGPAHPAPPDPGGAGRPRRPYARPPPGLPTRLPPGHHRPPTRQVGRPHPAHRGHRLLPQRGLVSKHGGSMPVATLREALPRDLVLLERGIRMRSLYQHATRFDQRADAALLLPVRVRHRRRHTFPVRAGAPPRGASGHQRTAPRSHRASRRRRLITAELAVELDRSRLLLDKLTQGAESSAALRPIMAVALLRAVFDAVSLLLRPPSAAEATAADVGGAQLEGGLARLLLCASSDPGPGRSSALRPERDVTTEVATSTLPWPVRGSGSVPFDDAFGTLDRFAHVVAGGGSLVFLPGAADRRT